MGTSSASGIYPNVIDWSNSKNLALAKESLDASRLFHPMKTYFLIGLTGELGQSLCQWMVKNGARHIALGSRNAELNPLWLEEMHSFGVIINIYKVDVVDKASVRAAYDAIKDIMPPITGVCNAAMVLSDKLFIDMTADTFNKVLEPKVQGTKHLNELFNQPSLDFFVTFSSLASVIGNGGQSNYHAANLFMASLVAQRRSKGLAASVINIGMVVDVGYVARTGQSIEDHIRKLFFMPLSESDIHQLFAEAVLASPPDFNRSFDIIMGIEPFLNSADSKIRPPWFSNPRFSHFVREDVETEEQQQAISSSANIRQQLETTDSENTASAMLQAAFSTKLESMMQLAPNSIDMNVSMLEIGCDSLLAVEIRTWFLKEIHVDIPVLKVLSGETVAKICGDAARKYLTLKAGKPQQISRDASPSVDITPEGGNRNESREGYSDTHPWDNDSSDTLDLGQEPNSKSTSNPPSLPNLDSEELTQKLDIWPSESKLHKRLGKMSYAQSRIWFLRKYLKDRTAYNITVSYSIEGQLSVPRFKRALSTVVTHHEILQTCFFANPDNGELMQGVMTAPSYTLSHLQSTDDEDLKREFEKLRRTEWSLERGQTFNAILITRSPVQHSVIFGYHHIVMDGVSWSMFLRDLDTAYRMMRLKILPNQYLDFTEQQTRAAANGDFDNALDFWEREHTPLANTLPLLPFARVKARYDSENYEEHRAHKELDDDLVAKIKHATQVLRITPFHFHLTIIQVLLVKLLDIEDVCIGITDANRTDEGLLNTVGFFLNLLPLRFQVNKHSNFSDLVSQTSKKVCAALSNSRVPFSLILDRLNVPRSLSHSPLFQVVVNYRMGDVMQTQLGDLQLKLDTNVDAKTSYDLVFNITQNSGGLCLLDITCRDSLYDSLTPGLLMGMYLHLVDHLAMNPLVQIQECSVYGDSDNEKAIDLGRGPRTDLGWLSTLIDRFDMIQQQHRDRIAIKDNLRQNTYGELATQINGIASIVIRKGVATGSRVAVLCQPSIDFVACMLAILQTGCVYVPLDLSLPRSRHAIIVADSEISLLLCHNWTIESASELAGSDVDIVNVSGLDSYDDSNFKIQASASSPAFLFYTSGSSGTPKGILLSHVGFMNYFVYKARELGLGQEIVLQQSSLGFDMSLAQIFIALANGGTLIMVPQSSRGDPMELSKMMLKEKVTLTFATPSEYLTLLRYGYESLKQYCNWRNAFVGGESFTQQLKREFYRLKSWYSLEVAVTNCYGPTEISIITTETKALELNKDLNGSGYSSVGKALPNTSLYIMDEIGKPVPAGFPGEIYVGGIGVALGYFGRPELNEAKFFPDTFATAEDIARGWKTMYKTGDKGKLAEDGSLIFMGRMNGSTQVKLRGLRIELEEVEHSLIQASRGVISDAVVSVRGDPEFLVVHVIFAPGQSSNYAEAHRLGKNLPLPQYMHPAMTIPLEHLPTSFNGKIDRKAISLLPLPTQKLEPIRKPQKPLTLVERQLKVVWEIVLQSALILTLIPSSDFFMAGGNSLLLVKVQATIRETFSVAIPLKDLYQYSTLRNMAARIAAEKAQQAPSDLIDWDTETAIQDLVYVHEHNNQHARHALHQDREILLTGATSFLGAAILASLLEDHTVGNIHCIAISADSEKHLPKSDKIKAYSGSLLNPILGLSKSECSHLEASVDLIIHAGAAGHCLNNYSSLQVPNFYSTRFLANLANTCGVPLHFLSSNRVTLLSGLNALPPVSVSAYPPPGDGSEGFTSSKWASECFLEKFAKNSVLEICIHRTCAVIGDSAPNEDALNALLRYSTLMRAVPRFKNFEGFFDFKDVDVVAREIVGNVLRKQNHARSTTGNDGVPSSSLRFKHYSGGVKTPVSDFRRRMEQAYGGQFTEIEMNEWISKARGLGIEELIVSYLEAIVSRGGTIAFPFLGEEVDA